MMKLIILFLGVLKRKNRKLVGRSEAEMELLNQKVMEQKIDMENGYFING